MTDARSDLAVCRRLLREGSKSFHGASLLLPPAVRDDASAVYAWCRVGDHAVDRGAEPAAALASVRAGLERIYAGKPADPVERAFASVAARHGIPRTVPEAMLEGFQWDVDGKTYDTRADVVDYCLRVASTVGVMMSRLMGRADPLSLRDACRLGAAMQLTNIARDVGEDAADGRLYLPREWFAEESADASAWLAAPEPTPAARNVVRRVIESSEVLYAASWPGIRRLPGRCQPAIRAAALLYSEIGRKVVRAGYDSVTSRVWTSRPEKLRLLLRAVRGTGGAWAAVADAPTGGVLEEVDSRSAFLVDAAPEA